jgi:hypothetical protein
MLVMSDVTGLGQDNAEEISQIVGFIIADREEGKTNAATMADLIRMGVDKALIEQAFAQLTAQQAAPSNGQEAANGKDTSKKPKGTPKWVWPVAIGGGVLLLGGLIVVATRR